ncbi:LLM class flavin-dependent oxidoreductase [Myxococcota bacterium]|nr:LLM class flavin-dependent oxidoreductase [Myxococcota bacterium]
MAGGPSSTWAARGAGWAGFIVDPISLSPGIPVVEAVFGEGRAEANGFSYREPTMLAPRKLTLSVVEQSPVRQGGSGREALLETLQLAEAVDAWGYRRFWLAEHHNLPGIASTSPEVLIGEVAARTQRIRVGSGGIMLPHYSALKVAENFRTLECLHPNRIDLGLGRAPGGDQRTAAALAHPGRMRDVRHYPDQIDDLMGYLDGDLPSGHPFAGVQAGPDPGTRPEVWLLGSGIDSALMAAERGLPFSFAHFFGTAAAQGPAIVEHYRDRFQPSPELDEPRLNVALQVLCSEDARVVEGCLASMKLGRINMARGVGLGLVPPEEALAHEFSAEEEVFLTRSGMSSIAGTPESVVREVLELADRYQTDDVSIVTFSYDFQVRLRSFELLAESFGLAGAGESA